MNSHLLAGGGIVGLIFALVAVGKLAKDWWSDRQEFADKDRDQEIVERTGAVTDAAAANAVVLASLKAVHDENLRLSAKVAVLEEDKGADQDKIRLLQEKLAEAQRQIQDIADELAKLKTPQP